MLEPVYALQVDDTIRLALPMDRHAEPVYTLIEAERDRLAEWLPDLATSVEDQRARYRSRRAALGEGTHYSFVIEVDGEVAGTLGLEVSPEHRTAEVGYLLASRFEGRGIVTRSVQVVIDAAAEQLGVHRFEIFCAPENARSRAVAARLGFRYEATLKERTWCGGRAQDEEVHALFR